MLFRSVSRQGQGDHRHVQVLPNAAVVYAIQQHVEETFEFLRSEERLFLPSARIVVALASIGNLLGLVENDIERLLNLAQKESSFTVTGMSFSEFVDAVRCCAVLHGHLALEALPALQVPDLSHALYKTYLSYSQALRPHASGAQCQCRLMSGEPPPRMFWESFLRMCRDAGFVQPEGPLPLPALERIWAACSSVCEKSLPAHMCFGQFLRALAVIAGQLKAEVFVTVAALGLAQELPALKQVPNNYRFKHYKEVPLNLGGNWSLPHLTFEALAAAVQEGRQYEYSQFIRDAQHVVLLDELQQQQWRSSASVSPAPSGGDTQSDVSGEAAQGGGVLRGLGRGGSIGSGGSSAGRGSTVVRPSSAASSRVRPWSAGLTVLSPHMRRRGAASKAVEGEGSSGAAALGSSSGSGLQAASSPQLANLLTGGAVAGGWVVGNLGAASPSAAAAAVSASQPSTPRERDWSLSGAASNPSSSNAHGDSVVTLAALSRGYSPQGGRERAGGDGPPALNDRAFGSLTAASSLCDGRRVAVKGGRCRSAHASTSEGSSPRLSVAWAPISPAAADSSMTRSGMSSRLRASQIRGSSPGNGLETVAEGSMAPSRAAAAVAAAAAPLVTATATGAPAGSQGSHTGSSSGSTGNDQEVEGRLQALEERSQEVLRLLAQMQSQMAALRQQGGAEEAVVGQGGDAQLAEGGNEDVEEDVPTPTAAAPAAESARVHRLSAQLQLVSAPQGGGAGGGDAPLGSAAGRAGGSFASEPQGPAAPGSKASGGAAPGGPTQYLVTVRTSNLPDAGTDATGFVKLYGTRGETGEHMLESRLGSLGQGQTSTFIFEGPDVGDVKRVRVRVCLRSGSSDGSWDGGPGPAPTTPATCTTTAATTAAAISPTWHLDTIDVVSSTTCSQYSFPFRGWFDEDRGLEQILDCTTTAVFMGPAPTGWRLTAAIHPQTQLLNPGEDESPARQPGGDVDDGLPTVSQLHSVASLATLATFPTGLSFADPATAAQVNRLAEAVAELQRRVEFLEATGAEHRAAAAAAMAAALLMRVPAPILASVRYGKGGIALAGQDARVSMALASSEDSSLHLLADLLTTVYARAQEGAAAAEAAETQATAALDATRAQDGRLGRLQEEVQAAVQEARQAARGPGTKRSSLDASGDGVRREQWLIAGAAGGARASSLDSPRQLLPVQDKDKLAEPAGYACAPSGASRQQLQQQQHPGSERQHAQVKLDGASGSGSGVLEAGPEALAADMRQCKARVGSLSSTLKRLVKEQGDVKAAIARAESLLAELRTHQAHMAAALMGTAASLASLRCRQGLGQGLVRKSAEAEGGVNGALAPAAVRGRGSPSRGTSFSNVHTGGDGAMDPATSGRVTPGTPSLGSESGGRMGSGSASDSARGSGTAPWSSGTAESNRDVGTPDDGGEGGGAGGGSGDPPPPLAVDAGSVAGPSVKFDEALRVFLAELRQLAALVVGAQESGGGGDGYDDGGRWQVSALAAVGHGSAAAGGAWDVDPEAGRSNGVLMQLGVLGRQLEAQAAELAALRSELLQHKTPV